ncbi:MULTISPECIES: IclR family transcriptional regulator [unclassified Achromobacter]|uniref:IclR family transcriptional regulator n=1 Tax=unclassified Achromobacter TaxID=2626865 RepID=UPI000B51E50A|nr:MULTISPECIES: IclR family transcriptional regulator [unclassified Achromobacter]OWT80710.1 IclR family transcriptional regulator [Achromobacter sp. HZ34]OWT81226.1 IclR family transcriptional regulator [Achromobacter sp. HZ28]
MSGPSRVLAILDLFTQQRPVWSIDDIIVTLGYARPTAYRYIKQLIVAGMLQKTGAGKFALGPRFIQLDYQIRQSDPVLSASIPIMAELSKEMGISVLLSEMFGHQLINVHHAGGPEDSLPFPHARGRPRPLFRGAAPKVMLAFAPRPNLVRLYEDRAAEIARNGLGNTWVEFRKYLSRIRRDKFYYSVDEVESGVAAAAAPVFDGENDVVAALSLAGPTRDLERFGIDMVRSSLLAAAERIQIELERALSTMPRVPIE